MDKYEGLFGFTTERRKYERKKRFQQRYIDEEFKFVKNLIDSQVKIPKGYNFLVWTLGNNMIPSIQVPFKGYKFNGKDIKKRGFKSIFKNIKVRFELE